MNRIILVLCLLIVTAHTSFSQSERDRKILEQFPNKKTVIYKVIEGDTLDMLLFYPKQQVKKKTPVVLYTHGGGWKEGDKYKVFNRPFLSALKQILNQGIACATIEFSTDPKDYLPLVRTRFEGCELYNYSPLIYAYQQENIAITGKGVLDGMASKENWWFWKHGNKDKSNSQKEPNSNPRLLKMMMDGVTTKERIFGEGYFLRPSFVQPYECKNILIEGITIKRPPMWMIHPVLSENITVRNVKLYSKGAPNGDGCDPEASKNILIEGCEFNNGDDCIAIKSGRNRQGYDLSIPSENIIIRNCKMLDGHGGVVIGSESSGGARNIYVYDCEMDSPNLDRALRLKSNKYRGGIIENIFLRDITVGQVENAAIRINQNYHSKALNAPIKYTTYRNIFIERMTCDKAEYAIQIMGLEALPIENIKIIDCQFNNIKKENVFEFVTDLVMEDITINGEQGQEFKTNSD